MKMSRKRNRASLKSGYLNKFGEKAEKVVMGFTVCLSIVIAVALFMILPLFIADVIEKYVPGSYPKSRSGN